MPNDSSADVRAEAVGDVAVAHTHDLTDRVTPRFDFGSDAETEDGLTVAVLGIEQYEGESTRPGHVVMRARITNMTDAPIRFENELGVLDGSGEAHRFSWVSPKRFPETLPGVANLEPGDTIEGESHVFIPEDVEVDVSSLSASVLGSTVGGCVGCDQTITLLPRVIWSNPEATA